MVNTVGLTVLIMYYNVLSFGVTAYLINRVVPNIICDTVLYCIDRHKNIAYSRGQLHFMYVLSNCFI